MSVPVSASDGLMLTLETSGDVCGLFVSRGERLLAEHTFRHGMHLSERLTAHLDAVLSEADATIEQVDVFAVGIGPGSFTGTRIGVMTMKTFAEVMQKPLFGVSDLDALAVPYLGLRDVMVVPMLPCRPNVVYAQPFRVAGAMPEPLAEAAAFSLAELTATLAPLTPRRFVFCGPALPRYREELQAALPDNTEFSFGVSHFPRVSDVAQIAVQRLWAGLPADDPISLVPLYIAPPPITLPKNPFGLPQQTVQGD